MINYKDIGMVQKLTLSTSFSHIDSCKIGTLRAKELAKGHWPILLKLDISNCIIMKVMISNSEIKRADKSQKCELKIYAKFI
jgi:hypothetical protein